MGVQSLKNSIFWKIHYYYYHSTQNLLLITKKPVLNLRSRESERFSFTSIFMLGSSLCCFGLSWWQVKRRKWKLNLIKTIEEQSKQEPIPLYLDDLSAFEYQKFKVNGEFDHSKELYLLPRPLIKSHHDKQNVSNWFGATSDMGLYIITPFKLQNSHGEKILINRGWVPGNLKDPSKRKEGQIEGEIELVGFLRTAEYRPVFSQKKPQHDIDTMAKVADTLPVFLDADVQSTVPGGPIGGQTKVNLRNEHASYIITWLSLGCISLFMWYQRFIR